jgi:hypothetical protein
MTRIVVDSSLYSQLAAARGPVELCSEQGTVVGTFQPAPGEGWWRNPPESEEELDRRCAGTEGRSMAEVRARVEQGT